MGKLLFLSLAALLLFQDASAQVEIKEGDKVRFKLSNGTKIVGRVVQINSEEIGLIPRWTKYERLFQIEGLTRIDKSLGRQRNFKKYFVTTLAASTIFVSSYSALTWEPCISEGFMDCFMAPRSKTEAFKMGAIIGGLIGLPLGFIVGYFIKEERWTGATFPQTNPVEITFAPEGRIGARLTYRW